MLAIVPTLPGKLKGIDIQATDGEFAVTIEFKSWAADFWISGLTHREELLVLARVTCALSESPNERKLVAEAKSQYDQWIAPIVREAHSIGGIRFVPSAPEVTMKKMLCEAHLNLNALLGNIGASGIDPKVNAARQYQLIKSIGFKSAIPMIAKREQLKQSTVVRRLDTAKAQGILPKTEQPPHLRD